MDGWLWWAATGVFLAWCFTLAASFGSFLNVVVWRMPRGRSVNGEPSHCPICLHPIRWYDNTPVIGWLRLGGRCRDCQTPIPARYVLVEAAMGVVAVFVVGIWVVGHGITLPETVPLHHHLDWMSEFPRCHLLVMAIGVVLQWYWLLGAALMHHDGFSLPRQWSMLGLVLTIALVIANAITFDEPHGETLLLRAGQTVAPALLWPPVATTPLAAGLGALAGMVLGGLLSRASVPSLIRCTCQDPAFLGATLLGMFWGLSPAFGMLIGLTLISRGALEWVGVGPAVASWSLLVGLLLMVATWRMVDVAISAQPWLVFAGWLLLLAAVAMTSGSGAGRPAKRGLPPAP